GRSLSPRPPSDLFGDRPVGAWLGDLGAQLPYLPRTGIDRHSGRSEGARRGESPTHSVRQPLSAIHENNVQVYSPNGLNRGCHTDGARRSGHGSLFVVWGGSVHGRGFLR